MLRAELRNRRKRIRRQSLAKQTPRVRIMARLRKALDEFIRDAPGRWFVPPNFPPYIPDVPFDRQVQFVRDGGTWNE